MWVGSRRESWQDVSEVLERFGRRKREAVARYRECVIAGWNQGRREDLTGGGLLRSAGGPEEVARRRPEERESADERILGSGEFVEEVWRVAGALGVARSQRPRHWEEILEEVVDPTGIEASRILGGSRERQVSRARRAFLLRALEEGGMSMAAPARQCAMNPASVSQAIELSRREVESDGATANNP